MTAKEKQTKRETINNVIEKTEEFYGKQFADFLAVIDSYGGFNSVTTDDLQYCLDLENNICLPCLVINKTKIGAYLNEKGTVILGMDPANCFNKTGTCSVIARFPMKKREYARFTSLFNRLINPKDKMAKEWQKEAPTCWKGSYASFC